MFLTSKISEGGAQAPLPLPLLRAWAQLFKVRLSYSWVNVNFDSRLITNQGKLFTEKIFVPQFQLRLFFTVQRLKHF